MFKHIQNLIKKAIITLVLDDSKNVQQAQIEYLGKNPKNVEIISSYGLYGIAPKGSQVVLFQVNGQEEKTVGIADDVNNRLKDLKEGEIALYNTKTGNLIKLSEDGDTIENIENDKTITIGNDFNIAVTGDINITCVNATLTATQVDIVSPLTNLGVGGNKIARLGDTVQVVDPISGTLSGTITSSGLNTSI